MEYNDVTVVIPSYNRERTIKRAIDSVLRQSYSNINIIVVDDASTDGTEDVVRQMMLEHSNISYIKQSTNKGACAARNAGINATQTKYIAFLDSDDEWLPEKIQTQLEFMRENQADVVFCSVYRIEKGGAIVYPNRIYDGDIHRKLLEGNFISTGMLLGRTECFLEGFDDTLPRLQDWDIMIRISAKYIVKHCPVPLANYYIQADSISFNHQKLKIASTIIFEKYRSDFENNKRALAGISSLCAVGEIMTGGRALCYARQAFMANPSGKNFMIYITCLFHGEALLKKIESFRLRKRCN